MKTRIVKLESKMEKMGKAVDLIVKAIHNKGVVVFPTESSYGIGCDATNEEALRKVFELKGRGEQKSFPILVSDKRMAKEYGEFSQEGEFLMEKYMPGPLTLVVNKKNNLPDLLSKEGIAIRIPSREVCRIIVQEAGLPLVGTSATTTESDQPLYKIIDVIEAFRDKVDVILDAGDLPPLHPSTVIDVRTNPPKVLRDGQLASKDLLRDLEKFK
ncbi:threonylcarbamoyl-AMP synthase [Candidatus Micrarchaeota archaeon]|nr:threonylcarbamoyl-AMP synthase [Candidatus Micrarchaeota archaeon]